MPRIALLFIAASIMWGCSDYNKVLNKGSKEEKLAAALEYYENDECYKSLPLLEELIGLYRGNREAEIIYYTYAQVHYCIGDYYLANYYFKNFSKSYPTSQYAEESLFLAAICSYWLSPSYSLDQEQTYLAINEFQIFLDKYPSTELKDSCNVMVGKLNFKLEKKEYEVARLYVTTQKYKSARIALQEVLDKNPATQYREDIMILMIESNLRYAELSIESKKEERYTEAIESYLNFVAYFPESPRQHEAEALYNNALAGLEAMK